ncbi:hypothetical protein [Mariniluteicoccus flavus]
MHGECWVAERHRDGRGGRSACGKCTRVPNTRAWRSFGLRKVHTCAQHAGVEVVRPAESAHVWGLVRLDASAAGDTPFP